MSVVATEFALTLLNIVLVLLAAYGLGALAAAIHNNFDAWRARRRYRARKGETRK